MRQIAPDIDGIGNMRIRNGSEPETMFPPPVFHGKVELVQIQFDGMPEIVFPVKGTIPDNDFMLL